MKLSQLILGAVLTVAVNYTHAKAKVEVVWENVKEYQDVQPTSQSRVKFREQTFSNIEDYINELAESLPDGQTLAIKVTNLDLAGRVWPTSFVGLGHSGNEVRVVKHVDIPRIWFSYTLTDAQGTVVQQAQEVKLKDMAFQDRHNPFFRSENLRYEKNMLRLWFNDEFPELIASNK